MSTTTTNLGLMKPDAAENYDVGVFNSNADTLDAAYGDVGVALDDKVKRADFDERAAAVDASLNSMAQNIADLTLESGVWTPTLAGATTAGTFTYATQHGKYNRIGKRIDCWCYVVATIATLGEGQIAIQGLPFVNSLSYVPSAFYNLYKTSVTSAGTIYGYVRPNDNRILVSQKFPDLAFAATSLGSLSVGGTLSFACHISYLIA